MAGSLDLREEEKQARDPCFCLVVTSDQERRARQTDAAVLCRRCFSGTIISKA